MQSLWMLLASVMFAAMGACIKVAVELGATLPHVVFFRGLPSVLLILFWALFTRRRLSPLSWRLHIVRNLAGVSSMWLGFFAIANLPLSTAVSLNYTAPLFIAGWMLFGGPAQRDPVRIIAVLTGFLGVLAVLRPSFSEAQLLAAGVGLLAGATAALAMMQVRQLGRLGEPEWRTVFIFSCAICLSSAGGFAVQGWQVPGAGAVVMLVGVGLFGLVGQLALTRAFGLGSPLLSAALQYSTILFAAALGIVFWGDIPTALTWGGMALIIASGLLSTWRTYSDYRIMKGKTAAAVVAAQVAPAAAAPAAAPATEPAAAPSPSSTTET